MIPARWTLSGLMFLLTTMPLSAQQPGADDAAARVVALVASAERLEMVVGESTSFSVRAVDASGAVVDTPLRVVGPRGDVELQDGRITALREGTFEVVATLVVHPGSGVQPLQLSIPVRVGWPPVTRLSVEGRGDRLFAGTLHRHRVRAWHADGTERPQIRATWSSSNPEVARVDAFGDVRALSPGGVSLTTGFEGVTQTLEYRVEALPEGATLELAGGAESARTGDVLTWTAVIRDGAGRPLSDVPVTWALAYVPDDTIVAPPAPGQIDGGKVVADVPGLFTVVAAVGPLTSTASFRATPRDVVQVVDFVGQGKRDQIRTTDLWVFEGVDGRDYAVTGAKVSGGWAYVWDVTDPGSIVITDSILVNARTINDMKVSPDARYATLTREGASDRNNGLILLDMSNPAHPVVASDFTDGPSGGVHNAFPTNDYVYVLANGEKYIIVDVRDLAKPRAVSEVQHGDCRIHDVWVHDGVAYSAQWECGVVAYDVGNGRWGGSPENPVFINAYPVPSGRTHAVFPYQSQSVDRFYLFIGDEIMDRTGYAWAGPSNPGSYQNRYDPLTGEGGFPLATAGYIQIIDFTDPEHPEMVSRYEVKEFGTHNIWVEDDVLYMGYYEGGLRVVDVSGELRGNLYTQGREIAVFKPYDPEGYVSNAPMVWSAMPHKGHIFMSDTNSGIWSVKLQPKGRPIS